MQVIRKPETGNQKSEKGLPATNHEALTARCARIFSDFRFQVSGFSVALSGGADSMALTLLADDWARAHGCRIVALTVDHALRAESRAEAEQVARWMHARGIEHHILTPEHTPAGNNLMQAARQWRYDALADFCRAQGIAYCLLGHHQGDQRETVLLNAARGGDGLSGMPRLRAYRGVQFLRPLLDVEKGALVEYLRMHSPRCHPEQREGSYLQQVRSFAYAQDDSAVAWIEDPSNRNTDFARVRVRNQLAGDAALRAEVDARIVQARADRHAREQALAEAVADCVTIHPAGYATIQRERWRMHHSVHHHLIADTLRCISGQTHRVRSAEIARLMEAILDKTQGRRSLQYCVIAWDAATIRIEREPARVAEPVTLQGRGYCFWDQRFHVEYDVPDGYAVQLAALGVRGKKSLRDSGNDEVRSLPLATPCLWHRDEPVMLPHIPWRAATLPPDLHCSIRFAPAKPLVVTPFE